MKGDKSKAETKSLLHFKKIVESDDFKNEVRRIRDVLEISPNGSILEGTENIKMPEKDEYEYWLINYKWEVRSKYTKETKNLLSMFPVMNRYYSLIIRNYIYFNKFLYDELERYQDATKNICWLTHAEEESEVFLLPEEDDSFISVASHNKRVNEIFHEFPISIRFRADVGQRALVDFIEKNFDEIKNLEEMYTKEGQNFSFRNAKTKRNEKVKERNDEIMKYEHLQRKNIMRIVNDKHIHKTIDYGLVGKVISVRKKMRKKV